MKLFDFGGIAAMAFGVGYVVANLPEIYDAACRMF